MAAVCVIPKRAAFAAGLVEGKGLIRLMPDVDVDVVVVADDAFEGYSVGGEDGIEGDLA
jgi:hypothetical protein